MGRAKPIGRLAVRIEQQSCCVCWRETLFLSRRGATVAVGRKNDFKKLDESGCGRGNGSELELG